MKGFWPVYTTQNSTYRFFFLFRKPLQTPFLTPDLQWWISAKMGYVTYGSHKGFYKSHTGVDWWMYYVASTITPKDMTDIFISINDNIKHLLNNTHHKKSKKKYIYIFWIITENLHRFLYQCYVSEKNVWFTKFRLPPVKIGCCVLLWCKDFAKFAQMKAKKVSHQWLPASHPSVPETG